MNVLDQARVIIYRINQKGLEILLVKGDEQNWEFPLGKVLQAKNDELIKLDPIQNTDGNLEEAWAVEADWHQIPSVRAIIKEDVRILADHVKQIIPEVEECAYFAVKEAFKKVLPHQYEFLKELKDIILDRNQVTYI